jgi:hypothetical protein
MLAYSELSLKLTNYALGLRYKKLGRTPPRHAQAPAFPANASCKSAAAGLTIVHNTAAPIRSPKPSAIKNGAYPMRLTSEPITSVKAKLPTPATDPTRPVTVATSRRGNRSADIEITAIDSVWWAKPPRQSRKIAIAGFWTSPTPAAMPRSCAGNQEAAARMPPGKLRRR